MKTLLIIGATTWIARNELLRQVQDLPPGSIKKIDMRRLTITLFSKERIIAKSAQNPHALRGLDLETTTVRIVGPRHLIPDETWDIIEARFSREEP
jgi:hypothetical protein